MEHKWKFNKKNYTFISHEGLLIIDKDAPEKLSTEELEIMLKLLAGETVKADARKIMELRIKLKDFHPKSKLISTHYKDGYRLGLSNDEIDRKDRSPGGESVSLDPVMIRMTISFLNGNQNSLLLKEVIALRYDGKFFVRGYTEDWAPASLAFLGDGSSEILDWISVDHPSFLQGTESPYQDGYVFERKRDQRPLLFIGRSGLQVRLTWIKKRLGDKTNSYSSEVDSDVWLFQNDEYKWEYSEKQSAVRRILNESCEAQSDWFSTELNGHEKKLLDYFIRNPGMNIHVHDLVRLLWLEAEPSKGKINNLSKHLQGLVKKLEPIQRLGESTIICNVHKSPSLRDLAVPPPPGTYRFGGEMLQTNDEKFRSPTIMALLPENHLEMRDTGETLELIEIIIHRKYDNALIVLGYVPYFDKNVLRIIFDRWGRDHLSSWTGAGEGFPVIIDETDGKLMVYVYAQIDDPDPSNQVAFIGPSDNILALSWSRSPEIFSGSIPGLMFNSAGAEWFLLRCKDE